MKKWKKVLFIIILAIAAIALWFFLGSIHDYESAKEIHGIYPVIDTEYESDKLKVGYKNWFLYVYYSEEDNYIHMCDGYSVTDFSYSFGINYSFDIEEATEVQYSQVYPSKFDFMSDSYILCAGFIPTSCNSLEIDGEPAEIVSYTPVINGEKLNAKFYYSFLEVDDIDKDLTYTCTDDNGKTYEITPGKTGYPVVKEINS